MVGIYYIATGSYNVYFDDFMESLKNFRIGEEKEIIFLTDTPPTKEYDIPIKTYPIIDQPWPLITLLKMWYIKEHKGDYNEVYYFNSNLQCFNDIEFIPEKLMVTYHSCKHWKNDGHFYLRENNPLSASYVDVKQFNYAQAGWFGGKAEIVYRMCEEIANWVEIDLKRHIIPKWHDENYFNKWLTLNPSLCHYTHNMGFEHTSAPLKLVRNSNFIPKK